MAIDLKSYEKAIRQYNMKNKKINMTKYDYNMLQSANKGETSKLGDIHKDLTGGGFALPPVVYPQG